MAQLLYNFRISCWWIIPFAGRINVKMIWTTLQQTTEASSPQEKNNTTNDLMTQKSPIKPELEFFFFFFDLRTCKVIYANLSKYKHSSGRLENLGLDLRIKSFHMLLGYPICQNFVMSTIPFCKGTLNLASCKMGLSNFPVFLLNNRNFIENHNIRTLPNQVGRKPSRLYNKA